jgi:hypothetical protein
MPTPDVIAAAAAVPKFFFHASHFGNAGMRVKGDNVQGWSAMRQLGALCNGSKLLKYSCFSVIE